LYTKNNEAFIIGGVFMPWDFGPYGKGIEGYIHYMEAFEEGERGGRRRRGRKPPSGGCLTSVLLILVFAALVIAVLF